MNHAENVRIAVQLAKEQHIRHVVLARRWPNAGWMYYVAAVGSHRERELRAWRRSYESPARGRSV